MKCENCGEEKSYWTSKPFRSGRICKECYNDKIKCDICGSDSKKSNALVGVLDGVVCRKHIHELAIFFSDRTVIKLPVEEIKMKLVEKGKKYENTGTDSIDLNFKNCIKCGENIVLKFKDSILYGDRVLCDNCFKKYKDEKNECNVCNEMKKNKDLKNVLDGIVCKGCLGDTKIWSSASEFTIGEIKNKRMKVLNIKSKFENFTPTKIVEALEVDEKTKTWLVQPSGLRGSESITKVLKFEDILDIELLENDSVITGVNGVGRAITGGLLLGGIGAIVGGATGGKNKSVCESLKIKINVNSMEEPVIYINYIDPKIRLYDLTKGKDLPPSPINMAFDEYKGRIKVAHEAMGVFTMILKMNDDEEERELMKDLDEPQLSIPDEILKYKELLDQGILSQEEFDKKKKELLNL